MAEASATIDLSAPVATDATAATAQLDQMTAALHPAAPLLPQNAREADQRLLELMNNVEWARKLMAGDVQVRREFETLTALKASDEAAAALAGPAPQVIETTIGQDVRRGDLLSAAADLRQLWGDDTDNIEAVVADALNPDIQVDAAMLQQAQTAKRDALADKEFTEALLRGERWAQQRMTMWNWVISVGMP
jgi:hypothetical protein